MEMKQFLENCLVGCRGVSSAEADIDNFSIGFIKKALEDKYLSFHQTLYDHVLYTEENKVSFENFLVDNGFKPFYYLSTERTGFFVHPGWQGLITVRFQVHQFSVGAIFSRYLLEKYRGLKLEAWEYKPRKSSGPLRMIMRNGNSLSIGIFNSDMGCPLNPINYASDVLKDYQHIVQDLVAPVPTGRLVILTGPPGTGKTTMIQGLIYDLRDTGDFIYVPAHMISDLSNPDNIPTLITGKVSHKKMILVLEDADDCLKKRVAGEGHSPISALLNMTDGLLGKGLDLRIVATTNETLQIDDACSRPGRLSKKIFISNIQYNQAKAILESLGVETKKFPAKNDITLANVYAYAKENGWTPPPKEEEEEENAVTKCYDEAWANRILNGIL